MYRKDYRAYLNLLRAREARPPFEQVAHLIAGAPARSGHAIPLFAKFLGALAIGGMVTAGYWALSAKFHAAKPTLPSSYLSDRSYGTNRSDGSHESIFTKYTHSTFTETKKPALRLSKGSMLPLTNAPLAACAIHEQAIPFHRIAADLHSLSPIPIPNSEKETKRNFFATMGGTISRQFSNNAMYHQTSFSDGFLGIGYTLSQHASVRILVGEENFIEPSSTTANAISFRDTTFVHDGQAYQNVIGKIESTNLSALTRTYWLGASYRYTLGEPSTAIRPFAEVMAGGSADGFLTHQSLGAEFHAANRIDFDLALDASELLPQNSGWLTKAGFAAALSFHW